jgi:hypothetical protein
MILVRHFLFGFSDGPSPLSMVFAGSLSQWTNEGLPREFSKKIACIDLSRLGKVERAFRLASPPRNHVVMHQCMRDQAVLALGRSP